MILLDTTVLVYAVGADHELREPCRKVIAAVAAGDVQATTTAEVLQEFAHVRARRRDRTDAAVLTGHYLDLLRPLAVADEADVRAGLELFQARSALGSFDALLAAVALRLGATLVSADRAFADVPLVAHAFPQDAPNC